MKAERSPGKSHLAAAAAMAIALVVLVVAVRGRASDEPKACCFTNERYAGMCSVTPGEGETCESVLEYLNNPSSTGRSYCGGTDIRGGWVQVECEPAKPASRMATAGAPAHHQNDSPAQP